MSDSDKNEEATLLLQRPTPPRLDNPTESSGHSRSDLAPQDQPKPADTRRPRPGRATANSLAPQAPHHPPSTFQRNRRRPRPFPLDWLPAWHRDQVKLNNRMLRLIPEHSAENSSLNALGQLFQELFQSPHQFRFHSLRAHQARTVPVDWGNVFVTRFHLPPDPEWGVLAVDLPVAHTWLANFLAAPRAQFTRPLGNRDFGLMTYLVLRAFAHLNNRQPLPPVVFVTEPPDAREVVEQLGSGQHVVELVYTIRTMQMTGYARLFLPAHLVHNMEVLIRQRPRPLLPVAGREPADFRSSIWACIGRVDLSRRDIDSLQSGDVLIAESHGFLAHFPSEPSTEALKEEASPQLTSTDARLFFMPACQGPYIQGALHWQTQRQGWVFCVGSPQVRPTTATKRPLTKYHPRGRAPSTSTPSKQIESSLMEHSPSESSGSSLSVFDTANITIEFRVGQAAVSVRDLSTLKTGQIIELDRPVSRTVDILADGHFVGVGELIDIEGRLGVRVTEIRRTESTTT